MLELQRLLSKRVSLINDNIVNHDLLQDLAHQTQTTSFYALDFRISYFPLLFYIVFVSFLLWVIHCQEIAGLSTGEIAHLLTCHHLS